MRPAEYYMNPMPHDAVFTTAPVTLEGHNPSILGPDFETTCIGMLPERSIIELKFSHENYQKLPRKAKDYLSKCFIDRTIDGYHRRFKISKPSFEKFTKMLNKDGK